MSPHPAAGPHRRRCPGPPAWAWAAGVALAFVVGFGGWLGLVRLIMLARGIP